MQNRSKLLTVAAALALTFAACADFERPPIPAGDKTGEDTSIEAVIPACHTYDTVSGGWSHFFYTPNGPVYSNNIGSMSLLCINNNNDTSISMLWQPGQAFNTTGYYFGSSNPAEDWLHFDFVAPDGNRYATGWGWNGVTNACFHPASHMNQWYCNGTVFFPNGNTNYFIASFLKTQ